MRLTLTDDERAIIGQWDLRDDRDLFDKVLLEIDCKGRAFKLLLAAMEEQDEEALRKAQNQWRK